MKLIEFDQPKQLMISVDRDNFNVVAIDYDGKPHTFMIANDEDGNVCLSSPGYGKVKYADDEVDQ